MMRFTFIGLHTGDHITIKKEIDKFSVAAYTEAEIEAKNRLDEEVELLEDILDSILGELLEGVSASEITIPEDFCETKSQYSKRVIETAKLLNRDRTSYYNKFISNEGNVSKETKPYLDYGEIGIDINNGDGIMTLNQAEYNCPVNINIDFDREIVTMAPEELEMLIKYYIECKIGTVKSDYIKPDPRSPES